MGLNNQRDIVFVSCAERLVSTVDRLLSIKSM